MICIDPTLTRASLLIRLNDAGPAREMAWNEFCTLYTPIISGFARRLGERPDAIDDLVQEVIAGFFKASPEFQYQPAKGRFRGYLRTCVCHKIAERRRIEQRLPRAGVAVESLDSPATETIWNDLWETQKLHRALAAVRQQYSETPERQKTFRAFELCNVLGRSTAEAAAELKMSNESVRAAKSRVSKAVRKAFEADGTE